MKILLFNWNCVMDDVEAELKRRGHTMIDNKEHTNLGRWKQADVIVLWNEIEKGGWADFVREANKLGIRTVLVQHGRYGTSRYFPPFNELPISKTVCVWGENDRTRLESVGVDPSHIKVTSTPLFKHLIPREKHEGINVVFSPEHWDGDVAENFIVADELRKLKKVNIITKILEGEQKAEMYDNVVSSRRDAGNHLRIVAETLAKADVVVSISESTFELFAEYLDIPVVLADVWISKPCDGDERYRDYNRIYSNACVKAKLKDLNKEIMYAIKHPEHLREERKKIAVGDGGVNLSDPLSEIVRIIEGK